MVIPNKEPSYAHFFHVFSHTEIRNIFVTGDAEIGYIGFGEKGEMKESNPNLILDISDLQPAPRVGFNLTFVCPEGQVFDSQKKEYEKFTKQRFLTTIGLPLPLS